MKKNKKLALITSLSLCCLVGLSSPVCAQSASPSVPAVLSDSGDSSVTPYSDYTGWRYKVVDGKLYRCLYNYTTNEWVGDWEICE